MRSRLDERTKLWVPRGAATTPDLVAQPGVRLVGVRRRRMIAPQCGVVELRQYTLHPGRRDTLIQLFDTHFVRGQEDAGITVIGQFRDQDDPDRFVWLRGFADLAARTRNLHAFYSGPVWKEHRERANATMIDSDNVLMMHPILAGVPFPSPGELLPDSSAGVIEIVVQPAPSSAELRKRVESFADHTLPVLRGSGARVVAAFASLIAPNEFPVLPVRDDLVVCWVSWFGDRTALDAARGARHVQQDEQSLSLVPTERSYLR